MEQDSSRLGYYLDESEWSKIYSSTGSNNAFFQKWNKTLVDEIICKHLNVICEILFISVLEDCLNASDSIDW